MLGLCHVCFTSGVELSITRGLVHCGNCDALQPKKEEKKEEKVIVFRSQYAYEITRKNFDKELLEKIAQDRLHEKK